MGCLDFDAIWHGGKKLSITIIYNNINHEVFFVSGILLGGNYKTKAGLKPGGKNFSLAVMLIFSNNLFSIVTPSLSAPVFV